MGCQRGGYGGGETEVGDGRRGRGEGMAEIEEADKCSEEGGAGDGQGRGIEYTNR